MRTYTFAELKIGERFFHNGNWCEKTSSRTARLITYGRVFYFGRREVVHSA